MKTTTKAAKLVTALHENVDAWYADRIDHETFSAKQRVLWDAIRSAGRATEECVLSALRERLAQP